MDAITARRSKSRTNGFTVLELVVSFSLLMILLGLLLPAVMYAREATRRTHCSNNLRQIGLALHQYHETVRALPRAWSGSCREPRYVESWASQLLPQIEAQSWYESLLSKNLSGTFDTYEGASKWHLSIFACPSDIAEPAFELNVAPASDKLSLSESRLPSHVYNVPQTLGYLPTANYVGVYGTVEADEFEQIKTSTYQPFGDGSIIHERGIKFVELRRGTSQTLLVGERTMATIPSTWLGVHLDGDDAGCRIAGSAITHPNCETCDECEFSSRHTGGALFLWADGHVSLTIDSIDSTLYRTSAKRWD